MTEISPTHITGIPVTTESGLVPEINDSSPVLEWDVDTVAKWIGKLGLGNYSSLFIENNIAGDVLIYLDHPDLLDIGVKSVGHRLQILKAIYQLIIDNEIEIEGEFNYVPPTVLEKKSVSESMRLSSDDSWARIIQSFEVRDERMNYAESEIKRLLDGYIRLREDLLPIFRIVKESKPLPDPDTSASGSPRGGPQTMSTTGNTNFIGQASPTMFSYTNSTTPTSPPPHFMNSSGPLPTTLGASASTSALPSLSSSSAPIPPVLTSTSSGTGMGLSSNGNTANSMSASTSNINSQQQPKKLISKNSFVNSINSSAASLLAKSPVTSSDWYDETGNRGQPVKIVRKASLNGISSTSASAVTTPISSIPNSGSSSTEPFKSFKVSMDDPCYKVLPVALRKYKINGDPRQYALLVCYGDQERLLGLEEKPLIIFKELQDAGKRPVFMLRHIEGTNSGTVVNGTPGGVL